MFRVFVSREFFCNERYLHRYILWKNDGLIITLSIIVDVSIVLWFVLWLPQNWLQAIDFFPACGARTIPDDAIHFISNFTDGHFFDSKFSFGFSASAKNMKSISRFCKREGITRRRGFCFKLVRCNFYSCELGRYAATILAMPSKRTLGVKIFARKIKQVEKMLNLLKFSPGCSLRLKF